MKNTALGLCFFMLGMSTALAARGEGPKSPSPKRYSEAIVELKDAIRKLDSLKQSKDTPEVKKLRAVLVKEKERIEKLVQQKAEKPINLPKYKAPSSPSK